MQITDKNCILESDEFFVQYHITHKCNLRCSHCYQNGYSSISEMPASDIYRSLKEISEMVIDWQNRYRRSLRGVIQLTGGEPMMRADWHDIADYSIDNGLVIILMTNGTLLTKETAGFLADRNIDVQVSLDGLEKTHNIIRGHAAYEKTIKGIRFLQDSGVNFSVNFTLMKNNLSELPLFIEEINKMGISKLGISRYLPEGNNDKHMLDTNELKKIYTFIQNYVSDKLKIITRDPLFGTLSYDVSSISSQCLSGCSIGFFGFCILPDGTMIPCSRLNIPLGNIKNDSIRQIWASSELLWKFRDSANLNKKCSKCGYQNICRGCRAVAYANSGDCFSQDPQCWLS